jgi:hypothetical protein
MMKMKWLNVFWILVVGLFVFACSDEDNQKKAKLEVWLTDAPGDFEAVNIDVQAIEINSDANSENGWQTLETKKGVYNLLNLTNGLDTLIGELELPAGKISQIRLKLGENNSIKINGQTYSLSTPSAEQSGLKLQVHATLVEGIAYKMLLDFDAGKSIVQTGNAKYKLKPVIRAIVQAESGAIRGVATPAEATPAVYAILNSDTIGSAFADSTGNFLLRGLPGGQYKVVFIPNSDYMSVEKDSVIVEMGQVTVLDTVHIEH